MHNEWHSVQIQYAKQNSTRLRGFFLVFFSLPSAQMVISDLLSIEGPLMNSEKEKSRLLGKGECSLLFR